MESAHDPQGRQKQSQQATAGQRFVQAVVALIDAPNHSEQASNQQGHHNEEELKLHAWQQASIAEISQHALTGIEVPQLCDEVLMLILLTLDAIYCTIGELLPDGESFKSREKSKSLKPMRLSGCNTAQATFTIEQQEPVIVNDLQHETRFEVPSALLQQGLHSSLSVVIPGQERPFGVLMAYTNDQHPFIQDDLRFLQTIAHILATAIERKRAENELEQALLGVQLANKELARVNQIQSDFVSMISHEFRSTLTSIQGFSELMRDEDFSQPEIKEYAADINADAQRLGRLIDELLDLNRIKTGKFTLNIERLQLNSIIRDVVERISSTLPEETTHHLTLELDETIPTIRGDRDKLNQVITNLLTNAIKYSPTGGEIHIKSSLEGKRAHVSVQDHGIGIPRHALEKIFEPYSRVNTRETKHIEGTGIGLSIVHQVVSMHGGKTWAESVIGRGATFHFILPISSRK